MTTTAAGLAPTRTVLQNGVRALFKRTATTPAVTVLIALDSGAVYDPADRAGLASFVSRVIDRGTASRTPEQIAETLDDWGVSLQTSVGRHTMSIACTCLASDFVQVLALMADVVRRPSFPEREVETRRGEILTSIRQDEDSPAAVATDTLMAQFFGHTHPYGRRVLGTDASIAAIGREALAAFHASRVTPRGTCVAIVGDVTEDAARAALAEAFGDWQGTVPATAVLPAVPPTVARRTIVVPMMNKAQTDIAYAVPGVARMDPDYYAWWLLNTVLGEFALGGRLGDNIRERQGMAYYVSSVLAAGPIAGPLLVRAGVSAENVNRAVTAIDDELSRMAADGPTPQEVDESRQYIIGSMPRHLETNAGIAEYLQGIEFYGLGLDYDVRLPALLRALGRDDVHAAARRGLDPSHATVAVAGPFDGAVA